MSQHQVDIIVIGGGATGTGVARDCALRGLSTVLIERYDIATGATGRNHGLLHSGARYAVNDPISAKECVEENRILKRIASHCVEETEGLFLTLPEDDLNYQATFIEACRQAGIDAEPLDVKEALRLEPSANPTMIGAVKVPDGSIDPFRLSLANVLDAKRHGAQVLTYHQVTGLIKEQDRVIGVKVLDLHSKTEKNLYARLVINAGGIWGQNIAEYADLRVKMFPTKGALLVLGHRLNNLVLNRCRKPADADILVPGDTITIIGTTSERIEYDQIDNMVVTANDVELLMREGDKLAPKLSSTRMLRAYAGVRPLVASDDDDSGRNLSRGIVLLDHHERDGLDGFMTITGGKLVTYRLMAEWATDLACKKLGHQAQCQTAEKALPGSEEDKQLALKRIISLPTPAMRSAVMRHGDRASQIDFNQNRLAKSVVCECEAVSAAEVKYAVDKLHVNNLIDLRRRTRVGMGTCQGELCSCRASGLLSQFGATSSTQSIQQLSTFLNERWKGARAIAWHDALRESQFSNWLYQGVCGLKQQPTGEQHEI